MGESKISLKFNLWSYIYSKKLYIASFFIPAILLFLAYALFGVYPFGKESVLVLDLNGQYVYYYEHLRDVFWGDASAFNSFSRNLSGETMGIFAYYLSSPFMLIPVLLPRSVMPEAVLIMQLCKISCAGLSFCLYLKKSEKMSSCTCLIFSIMYSLMSYIVVQLMNPMWLDALILLPFVCFGIEKLIDKGKWLWFIIPLTLVFITNFYIGWMMAIFSIIYFIVYYFFLSEETVPFRFRHLLKSGTIFSVSGILSAGLSSWVLIPLYYSLKLGKFDFTDPQFVWKTNFNILDFFTNFMPNSYDTCRPEGSPVLYCGVLAVFLLPLFFFNNNISLRRKIGYGFLSLVLFLSMYISNVDIVWHGFQVPNWLPYRYSFMLSFVVILMAAQAFERLEGISFKAIGAVMFILLFWYFYVDKQGLDRTNVIYSIWYAILLTAIYALVLYYFKKCEESRAPSVVLIVFVALEMTVSTVYNIVAIDSDVVYSKHASYGDYIALGRDTVDKIEDMDDTPFYRIEKDFHRTVNDAMAFGSYGISHSSSTLNKAPIEFLRKLGFSYGGHYIKYKGATYFTDDLLGIKYVMEKGEAADNNILNRLPGFEDIEENEILQQEKKPVVAKSKHYNNLVLANGNSKEIFYVYENDDALPIGFVADNAVLDLNISGDNPFYNQNKLLSALLSEDYTEYFKRIDIDEIIPENARLSTYAGHDKYVPVEEGKNSHIEFRVTAPTKDMVYMYFPSNYERKVNLWLNKEFVDYYYETGCKTIVPLGRFDEGEQFSFITTITEDKNEVLFKDKYFYYLDEEKYSEALDKLHRGEFNVEYFRENHIKGNVTSEKDGVLFTTISYEPGWTIYVDGEKTEAVELCDALIGIPLTKGTHTIEMKFFPEGMKTGLLITIASLVAFIVIAFIEIRNSRRGILLNRLIG